MISFVVQNETHAENFAILSRALVERGVPHTDVELLHLDVATGLETIQEESVKSSLLKLPYTEPFYRLSARDRVKYMFRSRETITASVAATKLLVIGNDGAIQRKMARTVQAGGGQVVMLLDGLLSPAGKGIRARIKRGVKRSLFALASAAGLDYIAPSEIGFFRSDLVFVMNEHVAEILRAAMPDIPVEVVTLPRHEVAFARFGVAFQNRDTEADAIYYVTSAYQWHGDRDGHRQQMKDIRDFDSFAQAHPARKFRIRVHPREQMQDYSTRVWSPNLLVSDSSTPLFGDLVNAEVVVTPRSTVALEALSVGIPVLIYEKNFDPPQRGSPLAEDDRLIHGGDLSATLEMLRTVRVGASSQPEQGTQYIVQKLAALYRGVENKSS